MPAPKGAEGGASHSHGHHVRGPVPCVDGSGNSPSHAHKWLCQKGLKTAHLSCSKGLRSDLAWGGGLLVAPSGPPSPPWPWLCLRRRAYPLGCALVQCMGSAPAAPLTTQPIRAEGGISLCFLTGLPSMGSSCLTLGLCVGILGISPDPHQYRRSLNWN